MVVIQHIPADSSSGNQSRRKQRDKLVYKAGRLYLKDI